MHTTTDLLSQLDGVAFIASLYPEAGAPDAAGEVRVSCAFHADATPSMDYHVKKNVFRCLSCGADGSAVDLWATRKRVPRHTAVEQLASLFGVSAAKVVAPAVVETYYAALRQSAELLDVLLRRKGIDVAAVDRWRLGWDGDAQRLTIPVRDEHGRCVNLKKYDLLKMHDPKQKYISLAGHGEQRLWPVEALNGEEVHLVEGELKMIAMRMRGLNALTITGGATGWKESWTPKFDGKRVRIVYDIDATGRSQARNRGNALVRGATEVKDILLPLDVSQHPKGGVEDYFLLGYGRPDYENLVAATPVFVLAEELQDPALADDAEYEVELPSATRAQYYHHKIATPIIVSAKDIGPFLVPKRVGVRCRRGSIDPCQACPVASADPDVTWTVESDREEVLELLGVTRYRQTQRLRELVGIPGGKGGCTISEIVTLESQNLEELRLVPQLSTTDGATPQTGGEQTVLTAYYVGHGIETNAPYRARGRIVAHPEDQHATMLVGEAVPNVDSLSTFAPTAEQLAELQVFQPSEWTVEAIDERLDALYADLETNVTGIYHRRTLHLLADLVWHSTLYVPLNGEPHKGWLDALVIGDSGQGKSTVALKLLQHYALGEWVDCKSTSVPGLKGGLEETGKRWWVKWGVIPLNDRRLVVLDEAKGAPVEVLQALTSMRSSGLAEIQKIERRRAWARTRLLWLSNPRSDRKVETYSHGVDAIKELFGSLEDVRRFDAALVVASNEVTAAEIAAGERLSGVPNVATAELCRRLILWCWSRGVDSVIIEPDAVDAALAHAERQGAAYSSSIPLVEPADHRLKLLRLAAALAGRTFSADASGTRLVVRACHVDYAARFLDHLYESRFMGYDEFSKIQAAQATLVDADVIRAELLELPHAREVLLGLSRASEIRQTDLVDWADLDKDGARRLTSTLVRANALHRRQNSYYKSGAFVELLRLLLRDLESGVAMLQEKTREY